jgi:hypothetical protein
MLQRKSFLVPVLAAFLFVQLGFAANYEFDRFISAVHFRIPLEDDLQRDLDFVFGLNLGYRLP